jgi:hypothetical protein
MRLVVAAVVWMAMVGGLALFMNHRVAVAPAQRLDLREAAGVFRLEVTPSFEAQPDPFALVTEEGGRPAALRVLLNGAEVVRLDETVAGGGAVVVEPVPGLTEGRNEFFVEANPPVEHADKSHAVRVRLSRDGKPLADQTFWSEPGIRLTASFETNLTLEQTDEEDRHGH